MNAAPALFDDVGGLLDRYPSVRTFIVSGHGCGRVRDVDIPAHQVMAFLSRGFAFKAKLVEHTPAFPLGGLPTWSTFILERRPKSPLT